MSEQDRSSLAGMTVNERLFYVGALDRWDAAVRQRDRDTMIDLLQQVEVSDPHLTVDAVLANTKRYGF
jgi:hypothetical protein